ncbi:MAG: glutamine--fructose-6-phosphate transaminase (isomerizing) [Chloroflexi bacterium]|nr:glutamine--fructose-6-phosphate transaminase (isomerizing) [Chloroflexota bacterium]
MCGIVGYTGEERAAPLIFSGLSKLEYRGYDSAGLACIANGSIICRKDTGILAEVDRKTNLLAMLGNTGIGHVRWATHGSVTPVNAHPHLDCKGKIAVVHNGIIENYKELRSKLGPKHQLLSDTDTEVIPHMIEEAMEAGRSLEEAVLETVQELRGSFAFLAVSSDCPGKIAGARKDSPLVVGWGDDGTYATSDTYAFPGQIKEYAFVEQGEVIVLEKGKITFLGSHGVPVPKQFMPFKGVSESVDKGDYDYFMLKEISEQPQTLRRSLIQDKEYFTELAMDILRAKQVVITACGTSRYAALVGRYLFSKVSKKFCDVIMSSEFHYFADSIDGATMVIAVSQSGETADVMEGVKRAKEKGATTLAIVNRPDSLLARISDKVIHINCGPEICVAATKSFTNQLAVFYLLSYAMVNKYDWAMEKLREISYKMSYTINGAGRQIQEIAEHLCDRKDFYYIARGINYAIASEGALKLKEVSYIHAEGMPAGELKHGTLAMIEPGIPVVAICPNDYTFDEMLNNMAEAKSRGGVIVGVSDKNDPIYDHWIKINQVDEIFYPLVTVVPLQQLAYYVARCCQQNPDRPRNLAKSVTVK